MVNDFGHVLPHGLVVVVLFSPLYLPCLLLLTIIKSAIWTTQQNTCMHNQQLASNSVPTDLVFSTVKVVQIKQTFYDSSTFKTGHHVHVIGCNFFFFFSVRKINLIGCNFDNDSRRSIQYSSSNVNLATPYIGTLHVYYCILLASNWTQ